MPIRTNITDLTPARDKFKQEITLLSRGYYAPDYFPDGKITIYPWDAKIDEWLLDRSRRGNRSREMIMHEVLEQVADLKGFSAGQLLIGDGLTILIVSRALQTELVVGYTAVCPSCRLDEKAQARIPDNLRKVGEKAADYPGHDELMLPSCKDVVWTRPLTVDDEKAILGRDTTIKKTINDRLARLYAAIVSVNAGTPDDAEELDTWYGALPPADASALRDHVLVSDPHLDTRIEHACPDCGTVYKHNLDLLSLDFFR